MSDEPSVMGAGGGPGPMPTRTEAEAVWRAAYVARMVECGVSIEDAHAHGNAVDVDLSEDPIDFADGEMDYWNDDGDPHGE